RLASHCSLMDSQPFVSGWLMLAESHFFVNKLAVYPTRLHSTRRQKSGRPMYRSSFRLIMCSSWVTIGSTLSTADVLDQFHLAQLLERSCDSIWPNQSLEPIADRRVSSPMANSTFSFLACLALVSGGSARSRSAA